MMRWTVPLLTAIAAFGAGSHARADGFGPWEFPQPDGYTRQNSDFGMVYKGKSGVFMLLPQQPAGKNTAQQITQARIAEILGNSAAPTRLINHSDLPDGGQRTITMTNDSKAVYIFATFLKDGQSGTALLITASPDAVEDEMAALLETTFEPEVLAALKPSALPAMDWPAPIEDHTARSRPRVSGPMARAAGLDPETDLLPGVFDCYTVDENRAMDARPDLQLVSLPGRNYRVSNGTQSGVGTWKVTADDDGRYKRVEFTGAMENTGDVYVSDGDGLGQTLDIENPFAKGKMTCAQDGPAADALRQTMAAVALDKGLLECQRADGTTFGFLFASGTYRSDGAGGSYSAAIKGSAYGHWTGTIAFVGGPLQNYVAEIEEKSPGDTRLTLQQTWHSGSMFYSSSETEVYAVCPIKAPARPRTLYGMDAAPAATDPDGGLPPGLYLSGEMRGSFSGGLYMPVFREIITWVAPGGRILEDPPFSDLGDMPDCTRARPDGEAFCDEYRITGGRISRRDSADFAPDAWDTPAPVTIHADRFTIDDIAYEPLPMITAAELPGTWAAGSFSGNGPGMAGGVGVYTDADVTWSFADGRFQWQENRTTTTMISPDPILGGASGGGSSSSADAGAGRYALNGYWLDLTFDDGRTKRLLVHDQGTSDKGIRRITIDGNDLDHT